MLKHQTPVPMDGGVSYVVEMWSEWTLTIGNGEDTKVWREACCLTDAVIRPMGSPELFSKDLKVADLFCPRTKEWNKELIQQILPHEAPDILCIKPSTTGASDTYSWTLTSNGDYSTKSGYYTALNITYSAEPTTTNQAHCNWITDIWTLPLPPNYNVFSMKITIYFFGGKHDGFSGKVQFLQFDGKYVSSVLAGK